MTASNNNHQLIVLTSERNSATRWSFAERPTLVADTESGLLLVLVANQTVAAISLSRLIYYTLIGPDGNVVIQD